MTDLSTLPPEIRALIEQPEEQKQVELQGLGILIAKLRDEAIEARRESGIETQWMDAEEAYVGIDDMNRAEFSGAHWAKPMSMEGSLIAAKGRNTDQFKATAFINETRRYVDAGASKVCEIAIPVDGKLFTLRPTPVPEMADAENDDTPAEQVTGQPMPGQNGQPLTVADLADHMFGEAEKMAEKAANRINDWMVEYKHAAELRKVIFDAARIGVGIIKGPIPEMRKATAVRKLQDGSLAVEMVVEIKPAARWLDPWCFYPAPGCGEDIHKGGYCCEVDTMLKDELLAMRDQAASTSSRRPWKRWRKKARFARVKLPASGCRNPTKASLRCGIFTGQSSARHLQQQTPIRRKNLTTAWTRYSPLSRWSTTR